MENIAYTKQECLYTTHYIYCFRHLVALRDLEAGELIFSEQPVALGIASIMFDKRMNEAKLSRRHRKIKGTWNYGSFIVLKR